MPIVKLAQPLAAPAFAPTDPLAASQWHLAALGNLTRIWDEFTGTGIHVGIYDDGVQYTHHDLNAPYDATRQVRIGNTTYDGINLAADGHGTSVAGLIAAENDGIGTVGIAFGATITGVNIFDPNSALDINGTNQSGFYSAVRQGTNFDVINNSWGSEPLFDPSENPDIAGSFGAQTLAAYASIAANGRTQGALHLGTVIVQAAGNETRDANGDGLNASRYTITVAAVANTGFTASYSNHGASILVAAPGSDNSPALGITTTDLLGSAGYNYAATPSTASDYTDDFGGTSAATPMVTAVVALMLDANEGLGWRDVQNILAASARQTGSAIGATTAGLNEQEVWQLNRADNWNGGGMHIQSDYGYGLLNAYNAVRMAEVWSLFTAPQTSANEQVLTQTVNFGGTRTIPDRGATSVSFTVAAGVVLEHIDLTLTISHRNFTDLRIQLTSAEGTKVTLVDGTAGDNTVADTPLTWTYGIDSLRGELSGGSWKLDLEDVSNGVTGTLANNFVFKAYGTTAGNTSVYHYTDELGLMAALPGQQARLNLADIDGGTDWVDAAAVSGDSYVSLAGGTASRIATKQISMAAGIENAVTGDGNDTIIGDDGANLLYGMRGDDRIEGGAGNDILNGGQGNDTLVGGLGDDQFIVDSTGDMLVENPGEGTDTAWISAPGAVTVGANIEITRLTGLGRAATGSGGAEQLVANAALASSLDGGAGDDVLWGSTLNNTLSGGLGDDIIRGQSGGGLFSGGAGNDQFVVGNLATTLIESPGEGTDTAWVTVSGYVVGANIEIIRLGGGANLVTGNDTGAQLVGNPSLASELRGGGGDDVLWSTALADVLNGGAGDDIIRGQGGADTMIGGTGNDQFVVFDAATVITERPAEGYDTAWIALAANTSFSLAAGVERGNLTGAANRLTGNELANVLVGDAVASNLNGAAGNDTLYGSAFADTLTGGTGDDTIYCYGGADRIIYSGIGWGVDLIGGFSQAAGAKLDFRGSGIGFGQLSLNFGGGNTQVNGGTDVILVFGAILTASDFLFA